MNKTDLTERVAAMVGVDRETAKSTVNAVFEVLTQAFKDGERVQIFGFGSFETREREAHMGHSPADGKPIEIPASRKLVFKASKTLK